MKMIISHNSAADFWRKVYPAQRRPSNAMPFTDQVELLVDRDDFASTSEEIWGLAPTWVTPQFLEAEHGMMHVLALKRERRGRSKTHSTHICMGLLPEGSLYALHDGVYVCSPELVFLQLAQTLDLTQLIAYGFELCGLYAFDDRADRGMVQRSVSLITHAQLTRFVESAHNMRGRKRALEALRFIQENSASPMETTCALLLSLPYRLGGYGLPRLVLNSQIDVPRPLKPLCPKGYVRADFIVPGTSLVLEYLGNFDHSGRNPMQADRGRVTALREMGYEVVELTSMQAWDLEAFEIIAKRVAKGFGKRIRSGELGATPARVQLRSCLRSWNDASGRASAQYGRFRA